MNTRDRDRIRYLLTLLKAENVSEQDRQSAYEQLADSTEALLLAYESMKDHAGGRIVMTTLNVGDRVTMTGEIWTGKHGIIEELFTKQVGIDGDYEGPDQYETVACAWVHFEGERLNSEVRVSDLQSYTGKPFEIEWTGAIVYSED